MGKCGGGEGMRIQPEGLGTRESPLNLLIWEADLSFASSQQHPTQQAEDLHPAFPNAWPKCG